jgi:hypothetical protein
MVNDNFQIPILFLVFNRLDTTKKVFKKISEIKPARLYIASDGPRDGRDGEREIVNAVRDFVLSNIDWDCEVKTLFRDKNLGCKYAVSGAIDWFFEHEEMGIILEDDCLPDRTFFFYCQELLQKYKNYNEVMCISGANFTEGYFTPKESYYFSKIIHIWGWASWRRAWNTYDVEMKRWQDCGAELLRKKINRLTSYIHWNQIFSKTAANEINTWDFQWLFNCWMHDGCTIIPKYNLIKNIGFDESATHTKTGEKELSIPAKALPFPMVHPERIIINAGADAFVERNVLKHNVLGAIMLFGKNFLKKCLSVVRIRK